MSTAKPNIVAKLSKGVLIDTVKGFVSSWNWISSCWKEIKGSPGLKVNGVNDGKPELKLVLNAGTHIIITDGKEDKTISVDIDTLANALVDVIAQRLNVNITGADSNVVVTKNGLNFTIGVYYK